MGWRKEGIKKIKKVAAFPTLLYFGTCFCVFKNFFQTFQHPFTLDFDHSGTVHFLWGGGGEGAGGI